jgi:hypothetical protein
MEDQPMKWLYVTLAVALLVAGSSFAAAPALAMEDACPHDATVQSLTDCVNHAQQIGAIDNSGVAESLLSIAGAAQSAVQRGQNQVAIRQLNAFVYAVKANSGVHIASDHADCLIMHANMVIAALK